MAPKKNANVSIPAKSTVAASNPVKVTKKRPAASRVTKSKPPLKTPSVVKVKIKKPSKKETEEAATICETVKPDKPIKYERHPKQDHLIELANQVAQFQLGKAKLSPQQVAASEEAAAVAPVKKGKPKKSKKMEDMIVDSEVAPPAPKSKKKMPPVKAKPPKAPPKPRVRKPKATEPKKASPENAKLKPPKSRAKPKSKKKLDPTSQEVQLCPDILNELRSFEVSTTPRTSSRTNTSRSSSVTSAPSDRFSWVKEISSSSTTTPTKELVCINGKLPEIKLVDYRKSGRRQFKRILDDVDSISGSSKTSESSTKRRKVARNTFSMSQRKFRLSLRKKNNSWTVSNSQQENRLSGRKSPVRIPNNSSVTNNNNEKTSSSSSEISARSNVNLSSSSTSSTSQSTNITTNSVRNKTNIATDIVINKPNIQAHENIQDIRQKLDSLDLEFINWLGEVDKEINLNKLSSISSDILRLEHEAIKESQHYKLRLSNCSSERSSERSTTKTNSEVLPEVDLPDIAQSIPNNIGNNSDSNNNSNENDVNTINRDDILAKPLPPSESTDHFRRKSCGETNYNNDDEDALSLFAESITGIDSSKYSAVGPYKAVRSPQYSPVSDDNEPHGPDFTEDYCYFKFSSGSEHSSPTVKERHETVIRKAITNDAFKYSVPKFTERPKLVTCVKKIADSTSVQKDDFAVPNANVPKVDDSTQLRNVSKSTLMQATYSSVPQVKSQVFRGVCFFNLISKCCKNLCNFPHQIISKEEVQRRVQRLFETSFISEYMLVRKYPQLRENYITTFVDECCRRDLTPILLEMTIDCYREDVNIRTHALETALLNISNKNLEDYVFILSLEPDLLGQKVCDVLMQTIADTQNFTRFKQVFVKLTDFMVDIGRTFVLDVAGRILERICILPYEESLANAILKIVQHTSVDIFKHPSMDIFENRLRELNIAILKKLEEYKKSVLRIEPVVPKVVNTSTKNVGSMNGHGPGLDKPKEAENRRYTSPDTTHLDTNQTLVPGPPKINQTPKPKFEFANLPRITRTIDISNSKKAKTYIVQAPQTITVPEEAVSPRAPLMRPPFQQSAPKSLMRPPFQQSLLRPSYLNAGVNFKAGQSYENVIVKSGPSHGNTKFSLLSKRFGSRDAPFW